MLVSTHHFSPPNHVVINSTVERIPFNILAINQCAHADWTRVLCKHLCGEFKFRHCESHSNRTFDCLFPPSRVVVSSAVLIVSCQRSLTLRQSWWHCCKVAVLLNTPCRDCTPSHVQATCSTSPLATRLLFSTLIFSSCLATVVPARKCRVFTCSAHLWLAPRAMLLQAPYSAMAVLRLSVARWQQHRAASTLV